MKEWKAMHEVITKVLNPHPEDKNYKSFQKVIRKYAKKTPTPLTEAEEKRWFSFESFLELVGLASINQEDSGGLYALHAHLNHSCVPNITVSFRQEARRKGSL
jgi:hypothetical protein